MRSAEERASVCVADCSSIDIYMELHSQLIKIGAGKGPLAGENETATPSVRRLLLVILSEALPLLKGVRILAR